MRRARVSSSTPSQQATIFYLWLTPHVVVALQADEVLHNFSTESCALQVIVVDEISNAKEFVALKDIARRGVAVVATAHGSTLQHLLENPVLNSLIGGKQKTVLGDIAAK